MAQQVLLQQIKDAVESAAAAAHPAVLRICGEGATHHLLLDETTASADQESVSPSSPNLDKGVPAENICLPSATGHLKSSMALMTSPFSNDALHPPSQDLGPDLGPDLLQISSNEGQGKGAITTSTAGAGACAALWDRPRNKSLASLRTMPWWVRLKTFLFPLTHSYFHAAVPS